MATPSYSTFSPSPLVDVLGGAQTALQGIAAEVRAHKKSQAQLSAFADTLEKEGLVGDAALYRQQAAADVPDFTSAAMTGKAAQRDYELPFKQAIGILTNKQDNDAAAKRASISRQTGVGVDMRQGLRLQDSILSSDLDIAKADYNSATRAIEDATNDAAAAGAAGQPDQVKIHKRRIEIEQQRQQDALDRMKATNQQRKSGVKALTGDPNQSLKEANNSAELPFQPEDGAVQPPGAPQDSLLPTGENAGKPTYDLTGPSSPIGIAGGNASKNLRIARKNAVAEFGPLEQIVTAPDLKSLNAIVANERKMRETVPYKSQEEAANAGNAVLPKGWTLEVLPKGSGYTYKLNEPSSTSQTATQEWPRGDKIFYVGEGGVMYERKANQSKDQGTKVQRKDGSGVTPAQFKEWMEKVGEAEKMGIPVNPPATLSNPTVKQSAQLPSYLLPYDKAPPNNAKPQQTSPARNMWNRLQTK